MPFPHEAILGRAFTSALVDAHPHGGNASPRAEEKALPRIASCGKVSLPKLTFENLKSLTFHFYLDFIVQFSPFIDMVHFSEQK